MVGRQDNHELHSQCDLGTQPEVLLSKCVENTVKPFVRAEKCERRSDLALTLARVYHSAYNVLHMRRLNELLRRSNGIPPCSSPVWILGTCHEGSEDGSTLRQEVADGILADFNSRLWFTYRKGRQR